MEEHIRAFQYSEQFKETAAFRMSLGAKSPAKSWRTSTHNNYALRNWVSLYQRKVQTGLSISLAMARTQKRDVHALQQHNSEREP